MKTYEVVVVQEVESIVRVCAGSRDEALKKGVAKAVSKIDTACRRTKGMGMVGTTRVCEPEVIKHVYQRRDRSHAALVEKRLKASETGLGGDRRSTRFTSRRQVPPMQPEALDAREHAARGRAYL